MIWVSAEPSSTCKILPMGRIALPRPYGQDILSISCLLFHHIGIKFEFLNKDRFERSAYLYPQRYRSLTMRGDTLCQLSYLFRKWIPLCWRRQSYSTLPLVSFIREIFGKIHSPQMNLKSQVSPFRFEPTSFTHPSLRVWSSKRKNFNSPWEPFTSHLHISGCSWKVSSYQ